MLPFSWEQSGNRIHILRALCVLRVFCCFPGHINNIIREFESIFFATHRGTVNWIPLTMNISMTRMTVARELLTKLLKKEKNIYHK